RKLFRASSPGCERRDASLPFLAILASIAASGALPRLLSRRRCAPFAYFSPGFASSPGCERCDASLPFLAILASIAASGALPRLLSRRRCTPFAYFSPGFIAGLRAVRCVVALPRDTCQYRCVGRLASLA